MSSHHILDQGTGANSTRIDLQEFTEALELAIVGTGAEPATGHLRNPRTASAFIPGSSFEAVDLGPGLWAIARRSGDGTNRVLCVHNLTDRPLSFTPGNHLGDPRDQLLFLRGTAYAEAGDSEPVCRVDAFSFVWLARFTDIRPTPAFGEII